MTSSAIIDTAIGIALVFAIFSTAVSRINEFIANLLKLRFKMLVRGLEHMFGSGQSLNVTGLEALFNKGRGTETESATSVMKILTSTAVSRSAGPKPSYLTSRTVALGVLEVLEPGGAVDATLTKVNATVKAMSDDPVKKVLQQIVTGAQGDRTKFITEIEHWYDSTMDRVSGLYKRMIQWVLILIAIFVVGLGNVDAIHMTETLYRNPAVRQIAAQEAATTSPNLCPLTTTTTVPRAGNAAATPGTTATTVAPANAASCLIKKTQDLQLPLFWTKANGAKSSSGWGLKILGLSLSVFALSFGATFWFDLLGNLVNFRNAGVKPTPTPSAPVVVTVAAPAVAPSAAGD